VIGVDAHKRTHTLAVVDEMGRSLATRTFPATLDGHRAALGWAQRWPERVYALEDCRNLTRRLEADLIRAGEGVLRVPARLMATARRTGRELGKSDPIDALAAARAALREPGLPVAQLDGETRRLRLLVDHREDMVGERTRMQSRLRWHVHELFPGLEIAPKSLGRLRVIAALDRRLHKVDGTVAAIARELLGRIRDLTVRINELQREITQLVRPLAPSLLAMPGCGPLSAAKILGEVAGAARFRSGGVRPMERNGSHPGLVGQRDPPSVEPRREPPGQRGTAPHRPHPVARGGTRSSLRPASPGCGKHQDRGLASSPSSALRRGFPSPPVRRDRRHEDVLAGRSDCRLT
jgi:transposase